MIKFIKNLFKQKPKIVEIEITDTNCSQRLKKFDKFNSWSNWYWEIHQEKDHVISLLKRRKPPTKEMAENEYPAYRPEDINISPELFPEFTKIGINLKFLK